MVLRDFGQVLFLILISIAIKSSTAWSWDWDYDSENSPEITQKLELKSPGFCEYPGHIENGHIYIPLNDGQYEDVEPFDTYKEKTKILYQCDNGYDISGPSTKTCINGEWWPTIEKPKCLPDIGFAPLTRVRRAGIKPGGGNLVRNKAIGGRGRSQKLGRGKKKSRFSESEEGSDSGDSSGCDDLDHDQFIRHVVIKEGEGDASMANGTIIKVSCTHGYGINLPNDTLTCVSGNWEPKVPKCSALPCKTPYIYHGTLYGLISQRVLLFQEAIKHTKKIELKCEKGFEVHGPSVMSCWFGEWAIESYEDAPECVPIQCTLPNLEHGHYMGDIKAGDNVTHETTVDFFCEGEYRKSPESTVCQAGQLVPNAICHHPSDTFYESRGGKRHDTLKKFSGNGGKGRCKLPADEKNAIAYLEGRPIDFTFAESFAEGTEITYRCSHLKPKAKNRWKAVCENRNWIGEPLSCDNETNPEESFSHLIHLMNGTCVFYKKDNHTLTFFEEKRLDSEEDGEEFQPNAVLTARCEDIGKYKLHGNIRRKCVSGQWIGITPTCEGLSQEKDYSLDGPPTILFRHNNGSITQSNDGKMYIYPGTTLHMECLWIRKFGTPTWETSNGNNYTIGWAPEEEGRDPNLEYRLSIIEATEDDSGVFSCTTPARYQHKIEIKVRSRVCEPLPYSRHLELSTDSVLLGTQVAFKCKNSAHMLVGEKEAFCLTTGQWSTTLPKCENVECPDISILPAMTAISHTSGKQNETIPPKITVYGRHVGGRATFTCPPGFSTGRISESTCLSDGTWSHAIPLCKEVICKDPVSPENGFVSGNPPYRAGDLAQFECNSGFMIEGQPIVACQDNGYWSKANSVTCNQACTYPGTTIGGTISKVRFHYIVGDTVTFDCQDGYKLQGPRLLHCLPTGKWSNLIPICIPK